MPLHFTAHAQPKRKPAAIRQPRGPSRKPSPATSVAARIRSRTASRSTTRQATALSTKTCRKTSSRPIRETREGEPVEGEQQAGEETEQRRPGQPPRQPHEDDDRDGAGHRAREPPAQGLVAEQLLAHRDQPLAQGRVDDEGVAAVVLEPPGQEIPGLGRVVGLVEQQVARVGDVPEPAEQARHAEGRGEEPRQARVPRQRRGAVAAGAGERPAARGGHGRRRLRLTVRPFGCQHRHAVRVVKGPACPPALASSRRAPAGGPYGPAVTGSRPWSDSWFWVEHPSGNPATWGPGCAR